MASPPEFDEIVEPATGRLLERVRRSSAADVSAAVEASCEIAPRRLTRDHVKAMREFGFNRASLGVQDYNPEVQKAVHRIQPRELVEEVAGWIREAGFVAATPISGPATV